VRCAAAGRHVRGADGSGRGAAAALSERAPFLRLALAEPEYRGPDISRHLFVPGRDDRHIGMGRGEDLAAFAAIAGGATIERQLDLAIGDPAALRDGGGEIGVVAAPCLIGGDVYLEEIGDVGGEGAEGAELAGLGGESGVVGRRGCFGGCDEPGGRG
jgi:hypothetical protein